MSSGETASCGFDFGTSNSSVGQVVDGAPHLIALQDGRVSVPTAIFFSFEDNSTSFGIEAVSRYLQREEGRLMRSLKSILGSSLIHETTLIRARRLKFLDIIAMFIDFARTAAGGPTAVVMGRPVHFVDDDEASDQNAEDQLRLAAEQAGFVDIAFQYEPIAAALDYERTINHEQRAFVVDVGGGTSDFSIVRVSPERRGQADRKADILGYSGVRVGGTDFDRSLDLRTVMPHLGMGSKLRQQGMEPPVWWYQDLATWSRINFMYDPRVATDIRRVQRDSLAPDKLARLIAVIESRKGHALLGAVEQAKIDLSAAEATTLKLRGVTDIADRKITRAQLEKAIGPLVAKITQRLKDTLKVAGVAAGSIDAVFLTGGSSRLPMLRAQVRTIFPEASIIEGDAFGSVATGLTIDARNRFGR